MLVVKLTLVLGLLGLAALNRFRLTPALVRGDAGSAAGLGTSILAEIGLVMAILVATATLGTTPPSRALGPAASKDASDAHAHQEHGHGHRAAGHSFRLSGDVLEVTLRLSNPGRDIAPLKREAERDGTGVWHVPNLVLAVAGEWEIELDVLISEFKRQTFRGTLEMR